MKCQFQKIISVNINAQHNVSVWKGLTRAVDVWPDLHTTRVTHGRVSTTRLTQSYKPEASIPVILPFYSVVGDGTREIGAELRLERSRPWTSVQLREESPNEDWPHIRFEHWCSFTRSPKYAVGPVFRPLRPLSIAFPVHGAPTKEEQTTIAIFTDQRLHSSACGDS